MRDADGVRRGLIDELEGMDRDRYAGPVGWMDAEGDGEWGIALRCARLDAADPRRARLFAGCGIVAGSDPAAELGESDAKLVPMRDALTSWPQHSRRSWTLAAECAVSAGSGGRGSARRGCGSRRGRG